MNNVRRANIRKVIELLDDARVLLDEIKEEEEEYRDNMPENLTGSERYEKADEAVCTMEEIVDGLEEYVSSLEEVIE